MEEEGFKEWRRKMEMKERESGEWSAVPPGGHLEIHRGQLPLVSVQSSRTHWQSYKVAA